MTDDGTAAKLENGLWGPVERKTGLSAARGDAAALRKLMMALNAADGIVAEILGDQLAHVARKHPKAVLLALSKLDPMDRGELTKDPYPWCDSYRSLERVTTQNETIKGLQTKIKASLTRC